MARGSPLVIATSFDAHNDPLIDALREAAEEAGLTDKLTIVRRQHLHTKGVLLKRGLLTGSMDPTYNGLELNDEMVVYDTTPKPLAEARLNLRILYRGRPMIDAVPAAEIVWLSNFFGPPNALAWSAITAGTAPSAFVEQVRPWLQSLQHNATEGPIILPFVRSDAITGWYASTRGPRGGYELGHELDAWLGPTYLSIFERVADDLTDPMASALRTRFGGMIYRFAGADGAANTQIATRLADFGMLRQRRPAMLRRIVRPVGSIRSDFERALLARDEARAETMIAELRETGRLNEENLRYLDVRLKAGLGLWPQIARDHWLVATMSDLALPPQIFSDIIEALYRTYIDDVAKSGDVASTIRAFEQQIAKRYPRLFASRRGIRTPRVVKAFLLLERLQTRPDQKIFTDLKNLPVARKRTCNPVD